MIKFIQINKQRNRLYWLILVFLGTVNISLLAQLPDETGARQFAESFFASELKRQKGDRIPPANQMLTRQYQSKNVAKIPVFVYQSSTNGFVLVAQSNNKFRIAGYSPEGYFDTENMPPFLEALIQQYETSPDMTDELIQKSMNTKTVVAPLLDAKGIALNQYKHEEAGNMPSGCVATAFAQIMAYYKYPDNGIGSHCYDHSKYGRLCADFEHTTYNWSNPTNEDFIKLSFHVGIAMDMNFGGAYGTSIPDAPDYHQVLQKHFKYYVSFGGSSSIKNELDNERPVFVEMYSTPVGHAAVVDGYDADGWFHINFGWGGSYNGYYPLFISPLQVNNLKLPSSVTPVYISKHPMLVNPADSLALVNVHNKLNGTTKWDLTKPVSTWSNLLWQVPAKDSKFSELAEITLSGDLKGELTFTDFLPFKKLRKLHIGFYSTTNNTDFKFTFNADVGNLSELEYLSVDFKAEGSIPVSIGNLKKLKFFSCTYGNLTGSLPNEIGNLTNLEYLLLENNQLTGTIPATIGNLTKLKAVNLSYNQLTGSVPSAIENFKKLESINLSGNQLSKIEDGNWDFPELKYLYLQNNQLEGTLPASVKSCIKLRELWLSSNKLTSLPAEIGELPSLKVINANNNKLTELPGELARLDSIREFDVQNNQLQNIACDFSGWKNLENINASNNLLEEFPNSLCYLDNLKEIRFKNNKIKQLPPDIRFLANKTSNFDLGNNGMMGTIPIELLRDSTNRLNLDSNLFVFNDIPQAEGYKVFVGRQKPIKLLKNKIRVMEGDTVRLNIKELLPFTSEGHSFYWALYPDFWDLETQENLKERDITNDSVLTFVVDKKTVHTKFFCKIFYDNVPEFSYKSNYPGDNNKIMYAKCLLYLNTEPVSFEIINELEMYEERYPEKFVTESSEITEKKLNAGSVILVPPVTFQGTFTWQGSTDGTTWYDLSENTNQPELKSNITHVNSAELVLSPKTSAYYRCSVQDVNCAPLYSDTIQVNPLGRILYDETINVAEETKTVRVDSIEVTLPAGLHDKDFRLTITKMDSPPPAPSGVIPGSTYDVSVSFAETFDIPLLIRLKNVDKNRITDKDIDKFKAVYFDEKNQKWVPYDKGGLSLRDSTILFETNHLTKLSWWWDEETFLWGYTDYFPSGNIFVFYKESDVKHMQDYASKQTPQNWHTSNGTPWYIQDVAHFLREVMTSFEETHKLPVPKSNFRVYVDSIKDDGTVGLLGMLNGYIQINRKIENPEKLRSLMAHEFMHYIQDSYIAAHPGNVFWMEAHAHLSDRLVWDENTISPSESEHYLLDGRTNPNSIYNFLYTSWDYWDSSVLTQETYGNIDYCYLAGTFLHYMRSYREGTKKLNPATLLKETAWFGNWRNYLDSYIKKHLESTIGDEYEEYVKYLLGGTNKKFTILDHDAVNIYSSLIGISKLKKFTESLVYKFEKNQSQSQNVFQKDTLGSEIPYLASKVFVLTNSTSGKQVFVNYKRLHKQNDDYKVYYCKYNLTTKNFDFTDISDSTEFKFLMGDLNSQSLTDNQNRCFLLLINKKNPSALTMDSEFKASFELTAMPVLNIKQIMAVNASQKSIHTYSDGKKRSFEISGRTNMPNLLDVEYKELYFDSNVTDSNDSSYTVVVNYGYQMEQKMILNAPRNNNIFDTEQTIVYDFKNGIVHVNQKIKQTLVGYEWLKLPEKIMQPGKGPDIISTEDKSISFKITSHLIDIPDPILGNLLWINTTTTDETRNAISNISHTINEISKDENSNIIVKTIHYVSSDYSEAGITADLIINYE